MASADAWYHSSFIQLEKRPGPDGLRLQGSFSWASLIDTGGGDQGNQSDLLLRSINISPELNRGVANSQIKKRLLLSGSYDLPFGPGRQFVRTGWAGRLLGGWSLHGISTFQDGPWFTVYLPGDPLDTGSQYSQWPDRLREANLPPSQRHPQRWFDTSAFVRPEGFRYGNGGRNTIEGPGVINLDVSLRRVLQVGDEETLEVRLEAFNSLNRANFNPRSRAGITKFGTPEFGVVGRALAGRQLQTGPQVLVLGGGTFLSPLFNRKRQTATGVPPIRINRFASGISPDSGPWGSFGERREIRGAATPRS